VVGNRGRSRLRFSPMNVPGFPHSRPAKNVPYCRGCL
jgi:hypothetical protein